MNGHCLLKSSYAQIPKLKTKIYIFNHIPGNVCKSDCIFRSYSCYMLQFGHNLSLPRDVCSSLIVTCRFDWDYSHRHQWYSWAPTLADYKVRTNDCPFTAATQGHLLIAYAKMYFSGNIALYPNHFSRVHSRPAIACMSKVCPAGQLRPAFRFNTAPLVIWMYKSFVAPRATKYIYRIYRQCLGGDREGAERVLSDYIQDNLLFTRWRL